MLKRKTKKILIGLKEKVQRLVRERVRWKKKTLMMMMFLWNQCLPHLNIICATQVYEVVEDLVFSSY